MSAVFFSGTSGECSGRSGAGQKAAKECAAWVCIGIQQHIWQRLGQCACARPQHVGHSGEDRSETHCTSDSSPPCCASRQQWQPFHQCLRSFSRNLCRPHAAAGCMLMTLWPPKSLCLCICSVVLLTPHEYSSLPAMPQPSQQAPVQATVKTYTLHVASALPC